MINEHPSGAEQARASPQADSRAHVCLLFCTGVFDLCTCKSGNLREGGGVIGQDVN